jgi:hypothetical protein
MPPALQAIGVLILAFVAGVILYSAGHWVIGMVVILAAVPIALVAWIAANDRV